MVSREKPVQREEHFVDTPSGVTIYTVEKRLTSSHPTEAVLLIHGIGVGWACWDIDIKDYSMMEFLAREGFDVFAIDHRGYGKSTKVDGLTVTSEACANDLKSVIDFIIKLRGIEKINVVGHSFGGMVVACLAGKYPEFVERIVLIGSPYKAIPPSFQSVADELIKQANKGVSYFPNVHHLTVEEHLYSYAQEVVDTYKEMVAQSYLECAMGIILDVASLKHSKYIPNITAPTLLINGALEYVVDPDDAVQCLNDLGAKQKALLVIGNAYHLVFLEKTAHRNMNQAVLAWFRS
jgi:pimeloyl-ACP methyl ester carboxylesterase